MEQKQNNQNRRIKFLLPALVISFFALGVAVVIANSPQTVTDNFNDSSKIASSSNITVASGTASLSSASSWSCGSTLTDPRDGKTYATVLIGSQCWMAQNLNVGTRISSCTAGDCGGNCSSACTSWGTTVQNQGTSCAAADGSDIQKYCYNDTLSNCNRSVSGNTDGGLYQWNQAMCGSTTPGAQGICPSGWHIPTHDELTTLERAVCASGTCATDFPYEQGTTGYRGTNEGTKLKYGGASGFNVLLAGYRNTVGSFNFLTSYAYVWSSLPSGSIAWNRYLNSGNATVRRSATSKSNGFSVRCLKN